MHSRMWNKETDRDLRTVHQQRLCLMEIMAEVVLQEIFSIDTFDPAISNYVTSLQFSPRGDNLFQDTWEQNGNLFTLHFIWPTAFDMICNEFASVDPSK